MTGARVLRLPDHVANQIAAGEVVGRPSNVVKELVENALDAAAESIVVSVEGGGVGLVRVVDDGWGMSREDARAALERHATSKLRAAEDLATLTTRGFRGEALPSIASVARFVLRTRRSDDDEGTELRSEGTGEVVVLPCGSPQGTTVEVRELFFNVPARRKFLRSLATESAHVAETVRETAFANPEVQLELWRDGRLYRRYLRAETFAERARDILGEDATLHVEERRGPLAIEALLSKVERARPGAGGLVILVNKRPVEDRALARAVAAAYGERLERGKYPNGVLRLELPTETCDVNVHPQKSEVRFAEPRAVCDAVFGAVQRALGRALDGEAARASGATHDVRPRVAPIWASAARGGAAGASHADGPGEGWTWTPALPTVRPRLDWPAASVPSERDPVTVREPAMARAASSTENGTGRARGEALLAVLDGVLVVHDARGVTFLDRRAVHESVLAREAELALAEGGLESRPLVFPLRLDVAPELLASLETASEAVERLGFDLRAGGPRTVVLHGVARVFGGASAEELARAALGMLDRLDSAEGARAFLRRASALAAGRNGADRAEEGALVDTWRALRGPGELRDADEALRHVPASDITPRGPRA